MKGRYAALLVLAVAGGIGGGDRGRVVAVGRGRDRPGLSPMGMELVPVYEGDEPSGDPSEVLLSPEEINAIGVRTAVARTEILTPYIETVGFVGYDEHRTSHIHMRTEGWIEDLRVRAVGDAVSEGDLLFEIYAPEIVIAISQYRRGLRTDDRFDIDVALGQLRNFGVSERQIEELTRDPAASDRLGVYAPQDGVVVDLPVADAIALEPGAPQVHENVPGNLIFNWEIGDEARTEAALAGAAGLDGVSATLAAASTSTHASRLDGLLALWQPRLEN